MTKVDIAGVFVDNTNKEEALSKLVEIIRSDKTCYVVTPYSEMIVFAQKDENYRNVLNRAEISLPDGIGILWAAKYLSLPGKNSLLLLWQIVYTGAAIIFHRAYIRTSIKQQVTGSQFVFDLAKLAAEKKYALALVGGSENVAAQAAYNLKKLFPKLIVNLVLSGRPFEEFSTKEIADSNSDILLIAYSPPKQEKWLAQNIQKLNVKVAMGLGGTFDYIAGKRASAPRFLHNIGLEWLWRLITQPWRIRRIWNAVPVFVWKIYKYKKIHGSTN